MEDAPTFNHERMKVLDSKLNILLFSFLFFLISLSLSLTHINTVNSLALYLR